MENKKYEDAAKVKLGIFSWFGFVMPLPARLKLIKGACFDATSLWWEDEQGYPNISKDEMPKMVKESGLILENIHAPFTNSSDLWSENLPVRKKILREHMIWLEDCAKYDIPIMVMHIMENEIPKLNKYGIESISYLTKKAEEYKIKIALENTKLNGGIPFVLSEIQSDYLGLCYDSSHARLNGEEALLEDFGHRLIALHISDNDGQKDRHWLPGNGIIDWNKFLESFPKDSYSGNLTLEVCPTEEEISAGPNEFLSKGFKRISSLASG
ncbi:Xylose isomerase domain-containing protein TIM barrel [Tepidanaerobacter acetatoxydans Re1]|uniref:Xylose isomerase domain-containing protein TIM barrel n=1 Tax=Tepidanaerobacter acetatoxydans (strain DSM 21804 / JCM 16047 / Re1) TaxID=1209989 RepID=F4LQP8_TEPAE|nr:sugar phosphate isomerase/epimerase [Tepidanaerobacter acetatoxydans]AEE92051.1 Xylose isomerase domain-containing protein TIM barrel [Tepidanaerobacter acetatoxydans Re1]CDI40883.1 Xylose isomerase domain-containing protein TIM barrel [Tepidanaerobacter acetatoxydans Re1]